MDELGSAVMAGRVDLHFLRDEIERLERVELPRLKLEAASLTEMIEIVDGSAGEPKGSETWKMMAETLKNRNE